MDHSYRLVNGNVANVAPSVIQVARQSHGRQDHPKACDALVGEHAFTRIICFIEDLFLLAKIQTTARKLGVTVEFSKGDKESLGRIYEAPQAARPVLLIFDLNNLSARPMTLIPKLRNRLKKTVSIIGFLNHLQVDLKIKAKAVGCDVVMPRSAFSQSLPVLLRRYGVEEEETSEPQSPRISSSK